jgi:hypothetical protein
MPGNASISDINALMIGIRQVFLELEDAKARDYIQ